MKNKLIGLLLILFASGITWASTGIPETGMGSGAEPEQLQAYQRIGLGAAAAFAVAVSILGSGYAVAKIGSAALGAAAEKPELLMRSLLFIALAEGLAVLGFAVAMILIQKM